MKTLEIKHQNQTPARVTYHPTLGGTIARVVLLLALQIAIALTLALCGGAAEGAMAQPPAVIGPHRSGPPPQKNQAEAQKPPDVSSIFPLRIDVARTGAPAHTWVIVTHTERTRVVVTLAEEGTGRWQKVYVPLPGDGMEFRIRVIRKKGTPPKVLVTVRDRQGKLEQVALIYSSRANRFNRTRLAA